ncbi:MAG: hypothetical protein K2X86_18800, partial [Cytophagaceae bacterium]|nr:hypothetical protein [Cytophagaceae bacterium]
MRKSLFILPLILLIHFSMLYCKKKESVAPPDDTAPVDTTERTYEADDVNIQYSGRISFANPKRPKFSAPGVYIKAKFKGNSCTVLFQDQLLWGNRNYYNVIIDDTIIVKITPVAAVTSYLAAAGIAYGTHTVTFIKRTESGIGTCEFFGFKFGGEILTPDPKPVRKIQFIGNSISCGSGIEAANGSAQCSEDGWGQPYHNSYYAFGPVLARDLNAEYHLTSVSGIGLIRNYSDLYDARPMPQVYNLLYLEQ